MKRILASLILLIIYSISLVNYGVSQSQELDEKTILKVNKIKKIITYGEQFENGELVNKTRRVRVIDQYGNTIETSNYDKNDSLTSRIEATFTDRGTREEYTTGPMDKPNYKHVKVDDDENNIHCNIQIKMNGDTVIYQKRFKDSNLRDSILFGRMNGKWNIQMEWDYDENGTLLSSKSYDFFSGRLTRDEVFTYKTKKGCVIKKNQHKEVKSKKCMEDGKEVYKIQNSTVGYRSMIKIVRVKGGKSYITKNDFGLSTLQEYFDPKGQLTARFRYEYVAR